MLAQTQAQLPSGILREIVEVILVWIIKDMAKAAGKRGALKEYYKNA